MKFFRLILPIWLLFFLLINQFLPVVLAQSVSPSPSASDNNDQQITDIQNQIASLQKQISDVKGKERTLKSQLNTIDSQAKVTTLKINETQLEVEKLNRQITDLSGRMNRISKNLDSLSALLLKRIVSTYKSSQQADALQLLFSANGFSDLIERLKYLQVAQENDKKTLLELQATKDNYKDQKLDKEKTQAQQQKLQADLKNYQVQLASQKTEKQKLLNETQGDEANYQRLLAQAQAQLVGFQHFVNSRGGASLLSGQTVCDSWGCYYNQRDTQWGGMALNHTGYTLAEAGCLLTSMAMVYTHFNHKSVNPISINSNPDNFASYEPAYLLKNIIADGTSSNRVSSKIDSMLSGGDPVIVGVSYDGGPIADHFVVLISGSNGDYKMNDPFTPNGHDIPFTSHYSVGSIVEVDKVNF